MSPRRWGRFPARLAEPRRRNDRVPGAVFRQTRGGQVTRICSDADQGPQPLGERPLGGRKVLDPLTRGIGDPRHQRGPRAKRR